MKNIQENSKNRTIILTGMMGAGKSTVGSILSRKLKLGFIDLDTLIEKKHKMSIINTVTVGNSLKIPLFYNFFYSCRMVLFRFTNREYK